MLCHYHKVSPNLYTGSYTLPNHTLCAWPQLHHLHVLLMVCLLLGEADSVTDQDDSNHNYTFSKS